MGGSRRPHALEPLVAQPEGPVTLVNQTRAILLATHVESAFDSASRRKGLLGRSGLPSGAALAIAPCSAVHTFGMQFPIDAVFIRRDGLVLKCARGVKPGRIALAPGAFAVFEFAAGSTAVAATTPGDQLTVTVPSGSAG